VHRVVEAAPGLGVGTLTLYAFSADNWRRPAAEVRALMRLFAVHLRDEVPALVEQGVQLRIIGRRDRLTPVLRRAIEAAESATHAGNVLRLRIAIDYAARDAIVRAAGLALAAGPDACVSGAAAAPVVERAVFAELLGSAINLGGPVEEVDLLIRTGAEQRLSDFMLWECAYAELYFTKVMWPDFNADQLREALGEFQSRQRRYGAVPQAAAG
jgi:undecaprenyl diphosphate synthase